ncbi:MAG: hypothetical protein A4E32_00597 [Methanomassiliicoccales archaeon PtaU1.Bin124]|nr:MAG: hypothetical protein A4E32_00597 [Methanomassiliicoccales archaeon PtaU1.Bin124]
MKNKPKKEMEGGYRLQSIRKVKLWLYATQLAIIIIFAIILLLSNQELSMNPFHIGIPSFLYFVLIMVLVIQVEGFIFLRLETWYLKSPSTKYYMTRNSIRRSMIIIVVALVFMALFWLPVVNDVVHGVSKTTKSVTAASTTTPVAIEFYSADVIGLTNFDQLSVMTDGGLAYVFIVSADNYKQFGSLGYEKLGSYRINQAVFQAYPGMEYTMPDLDYGKYYICIYSASGNPVDMTVTYNAEVSPLLAWYIPWFAIFFVIVNVVWIFYIRPINKLFERAAIYR